MYLLDTNVIIDHLRKKHYIDLQVISQAAITYFTLAELVYGVYRSQDKKKNLNLVNNFIHDFNIQFVEVNQNVVYVFSKIKVDLEKKGEKLEDFDVFIAASAKANDLTLVTNNKNHFKKIKGLKIH